MNRIIRLTLALICLISTFSVLSAQEISGKIISSSDLKPLEGIKIQIQGTNEQGFSDSYGFFKLRMGNGSNSLIITGESIQDEIVPLYSNPGEDINLGNIEVVYANTQDLLDVIVLTDDDLSDESGNENVSSLLSASRDVFLGLAGFNLNAARYNYRGLARYTSQVYLNGIQLNDLEDGGFSYSLMGGLNDVQRNRENTFSLEPSSFAFGDIGLINNINVRPSQQWKQTRASYAISNRSYRNRIMVTHSTGLMDNGWALTLSGSRRWAEEGYVRGTFYDAYSYFIGVEKKLNKQHSISAVALNAPQKRGRSGPSVQEMLDIADDNFYNPYWGFQQGEVRNARVYDSNQPVFMLTHDWTPSRKLSLSTSAYYQTGTFGSSNLDWYNAPDPRPDYWRNLPSAIDADNVRAEVTTLFANNEAARQIDWNGFYNANRNALETIENVDGIEGNDVTGNLSRYVVQEQHFDVDKFIINTNLQTQLSDKVTMNAGASYTKEVDHNYVLLQDLLGGDFYIDFDKFAERDFPGNTDILQNDVNRPNRLVREGDRFLWDYDINVNKINAWTAFAINVNRLDINLAANVSNTVFWREGFTQNGKFPDNSFGLSDKYSFTNVATKVGLTYALNGRNYIYANGYYGTDAPFARNSYISPRTRDEVVPDLQSATKTSGELGFITRNANFNARVAGFYAQLEDQTEVSSFYHDDLNTFVNFLLTDVGQEHFGIEAAFEYKLTSTLRLSALAALGQYTYNSRPNAFISQDNNADLLAEDITIYQKGFYVPNLPQTAYTFEVNYNSPKFWFAKLSFNYFDRMFVDFNPSRRTIDGGSWSNEDIAQNPDLISNIINQEQVSADFTMDFFGGKSWKIDDYFVYLNVGVNNILNNTDFRTGGFEQSRFDFATRDVDRFPPRYFYAFGRNYFVSLTFRL